MCPVVGQIVNVYFTPTPKTFQTICFYRNKTPVFIAFHYGVMHSRSLIPDWPVTGAERLASVVAILFYSWRRETCETVRGDGWYDKQGRREVLKTVHKQNPDQGERRQRLLFDLCSNNVYVHKRRNDNNNKKENASIESLRLEICKQWCRGVGWVSQCAKDDNYEQKLIVANVLRNKYSRVFVQRF